MPDSPYSAFPAAPGSVVQSATTWQVEIGRMRLALTRTSETRGAFAVAARHAGKPAWPFATGAFAGVGAVALLVAGASAAPREAASARYMVSVPVPTAVEHHVARATPRKLAAGVSAPRAATPLAAVTSGERLDAGDEPYVARAMATGAFQEWEDGLGQRRFLTAGPARAEGGRFCRDLALLVRSAEGGSHVRSAERCTTGPVSDPQPAQDPAGAVE